MAGIRCLDEGGKPVIVEFQLPDTGEIDKISVRPVLKTAPENEVLKDRLIAEAAANLSAWLSTPEGQTELRKLLKRYSWLVNLLTRGETVEPAYIFCQMSQ